MFAKVQKKIISPSDDQSQKSVSDFYVSLLDTSLRTSQMIYDSAQPIEWINFPIFHAVASPFPRIRYLVGWDAYIVSWIKMFLPDFFWDFFLISMINIRLFIYERILKKVK